MGWSEIMAMVFTTCSLLMLVISIMDHHWILVESKMLVYYSGIWKVCIKLVCTNMISMAPNVQGAKTLLVLAVFSGFVGASFMTFTYRYSESFEMYRYQVAAMGSFITASLVFLALSIYTIRISTHEFTRTGKITFQWSFYLAWTTCPCFVLNGLFALIAHQQLLIHGSTMTDGGSTITSSSSSLGSSIISSNSVEEEEEGDEEEESDEEEEEEEDQGGKEEEEEEEEKNLLYQVKNSKGSLLLV